MSTAITPMMHLIKFVCSDSKVAPIEVECTCGASLPAKTGLEAMSVARTHITSARENELSDAITSTIVEVAE